MSNANITIHNIETNEIEIREMTDEENNEHLARLKAAKDDLAKFEATKKAKKAALLKLEELGLTADDLKALGL